MELEMTDAGGNQHAQMEEFARIAVTTARDKFGCTLNFTESSLQELDGLLQKAFESYHQSLSIVSISKGGLGKTIRVWGSYLGEAIRRN